MGRLKVNDGRDEDVGKPGQQNIEEAAAPWGDRSVLQGPAVAVVVQAEGAFCSRALVLAAGLLRSKPVQPAH